MGPNKIIMDTLDRDSLVEILTFLSITELDRVEESLPNEEESSSPSDWNAIVQEAWKFHAHRLGACFPEIDATSATRSAHAGGEENNLSIFDYKQAVRDFLRVQSFTNQARKAQGSHYGANEGSLGRSLGRTSMGYPVTPRQDCGGCNLPNFSRPCLRRMRGNFGNDPALRFFVRLGSYTSHLPHYSGWALEKRNSSSRRKLILELSRGVLYSDIMIGTDMLSGFELTISAMDVVTGEIQLAFAAGGASYSYHQEDMRCGGFVQFYPRSMDVHPNPMSLAHHLPPKIHAKLFSGMRCCPNQEDEECPQSCNGRGSTLSISIDGLVRVVSI